MKKYKCTICGYIHDENENGKFDELGSDYVCPICGAPKELFEEEENNEEKVVNSSPEKEIEADDIKELNDLEISVICSNLARGCEKQYMERESLLFKKLADYFNKNNNGDLINNDELMNLINKDLENNLKNAEKNALEHNDRGALRSLTWSSKVTSILKILLNKYQNSDMLDEKVFVCTICGFIFVGDKVPDICPVCKVQSNKFIEVED